MKGHKTKVVCFNLKECDLSEGLHHFLPMPSREAVEVMKLNFYTELRSVPCQVEKPTHMSRLVKLLPSREAQVVVSTHEDACQLAES